MRSYLKLIGSADNPITEHPYYGRYDCVQVGFRKARRPAIRCGDRLFLYAPGGSKRVFALAEATSDPELNPDYNPEEIGSCRWNLPVKYSINLPVAAGIHIDEVSSERSLTRSLRRQSHIKLAPEEDQSACKLLDRAEASYSNPESHDK